MSLAGPYRSQISAKLGKGMSAPGRVREGDERPWQG